MKSFGSRENGKMPFGFKITLAASVVLLIAVIGGFMTTTFESHLVIVLMGFVGFFALIASTFAWETMGHLRRYVRAAFVGLPSALALFGVVCAVYTALFRAPADAVLNLSSSSADTPFSYTLLFDLSVTLSYGQVILLFLLPAVTAAASYGEAIDRRILRGTATAQLAMMLFNVLYTSPAHQIPTWNTGEVYMPSWYIASLETEITLVQGIALVLSVLFALLTWWPSKKKSAA